MRLAPILRHQCPRCGQGRVFEALLATRRACAVCGIVFEREPGYFLGAMYFSYAMAVATVTPVVVAGVLLGWPHPVTGVVCGVLLVALAPWLYRTSRVLWLHFDQHFDPRP